MKRKTALHSRTIPQSYDEKSDHELLDLYVAGDHQAFDHFYARHERRLYRRMACFTTDRCLLDDAFQNTWIKFIDNIDHILATTSREPQGAKPLWTLYPYLRTMAQRTLQDALKRKYRTHEIGVEAGVDTQTSESEYVFAHATDPYELQPDSALEVDQLLNQLMQALASLPHAQRDAWLLNREGYKIDEILRLQNINREAYRSQLRRAKQKLQPILDDLVSQTCQ